MSLHLTPEILEASYELLRATPPFVRWKLPPSEEVAFHVMNCRTPAADYCFHEGTHIIRASNKRHGQLKSLLETMAHEMCHLRERQLKVRADIMHGTVFHRLADQVCKHHGFDRGTF